MKETSKYGSIDRHLWDEINGRPACELPVYAKGTHTFTARIREVTCEACKETEVYQKELRHANGVS